MFGWLSTLCFAISPLFLAAQVKFDGHAKGLHALFIWPWVLGEVLATIHAVVAIGWENPVTWPLFLNYLTNAYALVIIIKYKYFSKENSFPRS